MVKSSSVSPNALLLNSLKHASTTSATSSAAGIDHPRALQQHRGMLEVLHLRLRADVDFMETPSPGRRLFFFFNLLLKPRCWAWG